MQDDGDALAAGYRPNPHTVLAFDAYYANEATTTYLDREKVPYTVSCKPANFKALTATVLPEGYNDRGAKTGDTHSIYNAKTGKVFTPF